MRQIRSSRRFVRSIPGGRFPTFRHLPGAMAIGRGDELFLAFLCAKCIHGFDWRSFFKGSFEETGRVWRRIYWDRIWRKRGNYNDPDWSYCAILSTSVSSCVSFLEIETLVHGLVMARYFIWGSKFSLHFAIIELCDLWFSWKVHGTD